MACQRPSPVVMHERDTPVVMFTLFEGDQSFDRLFNYSPELYIVDPEGKLAGVFGLRPLGGGRLGLEALTGTTGADFYETLFSLKPDISYSCQIYFQPVDPPSEDIGLYDIVYPHWMDYIPPEDHIPGWFSGETKQGRTVPVEFPWDVLESYRLREAQNG